MSRRRGLLLAAAFASALAACGAEEGTVRVVDGDVMVTHFVPPEAYAAFLAGSLAEADGRLDVARARYSDAVSVDSDDPLLWASLGRVLCKLPGLQREADRALSQALSLDPSFSTALAANGDCAASRKENARASHDLVSAANADPRKVELDARAIAALERDSPDAARARMLAATRAYGSRPEAWDTLLTWSTEHGDAALALLGARGLASARPAKYASFARAAIALAGLGATREAREIAALAIAGKADGATCDPFVARLAVDHALTRTDASSASSVAGIAARGHVALGEVAARALLLGRTEAARDLALTVTRADPGDRDALAVIAALSERPAKGAAPGASVLSGAAFIALTSDLALRASTDTARVFARGAQHAAFDGRDALIVDAAVDLAAADVLTPETDTERLELALRRGEPAKLLPDLDARHELVARLLRKSDAPDDVRARALASRLSFVLSRDPLLVYATLEGARRTRALTPAELATLEKSPPSPLLLALRVNVAGSSSASAPDKARLAAFARTPYERKLSGM